MTHTHYTSRPMMTDWSGEISGGPVVPVSATASASTTTTTTTTSSASAAPAAPGYAPAAPAPAAAAPGSAPAAPAPAAAAPGSAPAAPAPAPAAAAPGYAPAAPAPAAAAPGYAPAAPAPAAAAPAPRNEFTGSMGTLDLETHQPIEVIETPTSMSEAFLGSLKAMLLRNRGNFVTATFLIGTQGTTAWEGILHDVGNDYLIIYQPGRERYIACDIYSLKYIEFYDTRRRELCETMLRQSGMQNSF